MPYVYRINIEEDKVILKSIVSATCACLAVVSFNLNAALIGRDLDEGAQWTETKSNNWFVWAVQSGDVGASVVPIPAAVWLFGSGLIGLVTFARRKT